MGIQINGNTNNINAGIGSLSIEDINELDIVGVATASNFKTGSSNLHSTGLTVGNNFLHSTGINVGTGATIHVPATNVLTLGTNSNERLRIDSTGRVMIATTVAGTNSDLTIGDASSGSTGRIRIRSASNAGGYIDFQDTTGNTVDGSIEYNHILNSFNFYFGSQERFRIHTQGMLGLSGANYGTSGQVLTSGGTGSPVSWTTIT